MTASQLQERAIAVGTPNEFLQEFSSRFQYEWDDITAVGEIPAEQVQELALYLSFRYIKRLCFAVERGLDTTSAALYAGWSDLSEDDVRSEYRSVSCKV